MAALELPAPSDAAASAASAASADGAAKAASASATSSDAASASDAISAASLASSRSSSALAETQSTRIKKGRGRRAMTAVDIEVYSQDNSTEHAAAVTTTGITYEPGAHSKTMKRTRKMAVHPS
jgi:hypothetical protein